MEQYARYRAPAESGQKLVSPSWSELGQIASTTRAWRERAVFELSGQSLSEFAAEARREVVARAAEYVASYHRASIGVGRAEIDDRPLIVTGHQPEMVHPGVWLKNFAAASLARSFGGAALNLVIDGDACRSTAIRVPGGPRENPRFASVEFDGASEKVPWEERSVVDEGVWRSFAERVQSTTAGLLPQRMLDDWWPIALERAAATGRIGAGLAQARHLAEIAWGQESLELPQSDMCQTSAFRRFVCHLLMHLPRFVDAYNAALGNYRRVHRIRNHAHPVPNLASIGKWLQAPFWIWSTADPRRRAVYVRREKRGLIVSDRQSFERSLPLAPAADWQPAVAELTRWEGEGFKLRSRALVTTMFARVAVADLFIHGIGGAKYDEATDAICERFFGTAPPRFAAISGTLRLPIAKNGGAELDVSRLRHAVRELYFHPEQYAMFDQAPSNGEAAEVIIAEKRRWIGMEKTGPNAAARHAAIVAANQRLQPYVANRRREIEAQLANAREQSRANRVLLSREYAFCLFPRTSLEHFLLDLPT